MTTATLQQQLVGRMIVFPVGLPGFPGRRSFELSELGPELAPFLELRGDPGDPRFIVVPPGAIWPDYVLELTDEDAAAIGVRSSADAAVLAIVTLRPAPESPTVNLLGPIVVNVQSAQAVQAVVSPEHGDAMQPLTAGSWRRR